MHRQKRREELIREKGEVDARLEQTFLVRLPMSWFMSIQPGASLTMIGLAAPSATVFGIILNLLYFRRYQKMLKAERR